MDVFEAAPKLFNTESEAFFQEGTKKTIHLTPQPTTSAKVSLEGRASKTNYSKVVAYIIGAIAATLLLPVTLSIGVLLCFFAMLSIKIKEEMIG
ncbi:MAG: hypothetical protein SNF33_07955 [Candidatus Algichlamydia australiensis]|nr:hypothetical protein [Chlamydiales bacterium]